LRTATASPLVAKDLGAQEILRADRGQSKIAVFADPQGAPFGVFEGEVDD
jgi:hypothetical protein